MSIPRTGSREVHPVGPTGRRPSDTPAAPVSLEGVSTLLRGLDVDQRRAVTHKEGPLLVVAGPGTGKTRVVTHRIAWLIATKRARPSQILALTFTDAASEEMQARVDVLVPYGHADTAVHTFHAFGDRLVREFAFELGLPSDPRVIGRADSIVFLREHLFELGLERYRPLADPTRFLAALAGLFSRAKDEDVSPTDYLEHAARLEAAASEARIGAVEPAPAQTVEALVDLASRQSELARAYAHYQELLAAAGLIDFGDQVGLAVRLLRDRPSIRAELDARYRHVLVDEFQDTNAAQLELVALLASGHRNITVVGDDDQSIYTFRGAALSNLLGFGGRFTGLRTVVLRRNHRSRAPILEAADRLIRHNDPCRLETRAGLDKRPRPVRRSRGVLPVEHRAFATAADEADWVAGRISERIAPGCPPRDIAILVRTNADAEPFLRSLNIQGIQWRFSGASGLYARPEVRQLLAFLRVVANLDSTVDLYAVATGEPYGLGGPGLTALLELARRRHRSLWWVLGEVIAQPALIRLSPATRHAIQRLVADLTAASELAHQRPTGEVLYDHLKRSGRLARLAAADDPMAEATLRNVARFFEIVRARSRLLADDRIPFFAAHLAPLLEAGEDPADADDDDCDAVAVLTIHKAKGLEFRTVFLCGLVEGRFPRAGRRESLALPEALCRDRRTEALVDESPEAEERRLCYVAMTRARDELILTHAAESPSRRPWRPSRFIAEALDRPAAVAPARSRATLDEPVVDPGPVHVKSFPAPAGPLDLSFSQLDDYVACPLRYRLRHIVGVPTPSHHAFSYGTALHQAVAAEGARRKKGRPMGVDELLEVYRLHWSGEGFLSREHEEARFAAGETSLRRYHVDHCAPSAPAPLAVEERFSVELDGDRVRGRFDRLDRAEDGGVVVTDFKSSDVREPAKARKRARDSLQLAVYALAQQAQTGQAPSAVRLHFLDSGVVGEVPVDQRRLDDARQKIRRAADGIRRGDFTARPGPIACGYCPFRDICPSSAA